MSEAQAKANEKYRKANVKSFNVKFFPADADVLAYFQAKENRNRYIKDLIRKDMERSTTDRQDMYSVQRNILPGRSRDVRTAPKSLPQGPCNGLTARCTGPEIWSQRSSLPPSMLSRASSQAARMARSIPLAVNLMIRPVERLTA